MNARSILDTVPGQRTDRLAAVRTAAAYPELEDHAEELLEARGIPEMDAAAQRLRQAALDVRRMLMGSPPRGAPVEFAAAVQNPELRRVELANLAVDVVTVTDYLLRLLGTPSVSAQRLLLADEAGAGRSYGAPDHQALDRLTRQQLDARGTAVRVGMRLLAELHSDIARY